MGQLFEFTKPSLNLFVIQDAQSVKTKGFYGKRGHDAAEDDRLLQRLGITAGDQCIEGGDVRLCVVPGDPQGAGPGLLQQSSGPAQRATQILQAVTEVGERGGLWTFRPEQSRQPLALQFTSGMEREQRASHTAPTVRRKS